jgi:hypothetical protein
MGLFHVIVAGALAGGVVACKSGGGTTPPPTPPGEMPLPPTSAELKAEEAEKTGKHATVADDEIHVFSMTPTKGPATGGTAITIRGANFQKAETVRVAFGKAQGEVSRVIDDEIVVQAPPGTSGQEVKVSVVFDPGANTIEIPETFTYTAE